MEKLFKWFCLFCVTVVSACSLASDGTESNSDGTESNSDGTRREREAKCSDPEVQEVLEAIAKRGTKVETNNNTDIVENTVYEFSATRGKDYDSATDTYSCSVALASTFENITDRRQLEYTVKFLDNGEPPDVDVTKVIPPYDR